MFNLQRIGGLAALYEAAAFITGFAVYLTVLGPAQYGSSTVDAARHAGFLVANQSLLSVWNLVIYVSFGIALVVLTTALHERFKERTPGLANVMAAFGLIWAGLVIASGMVANIGMGVIVDLHGRDPAEAGLVWQSYKFVVGGLGGGNEIVGGLWLLLISLAAWRSKTLPRLLNVVGGVVGLAGLLTTVPVLQELGSVFGLGLIVWFAWAGVVMLGSRSAIAGSATLRAHPANGISAAETPA